MAGVTLFVNCHTRPKLAWNTYFKVIQTAIKRSYQTAMNTADLCDAYGDALQYVEPCFKDYGKMKKFHGMISTVKCFEDNSKVKEALAEPGQGKV